MTSYIGVPPFSQSVRTTTSLTASNNQTTFYPTGGYIVGYIDVSVNGVKLIEGSDFIAGDGTSIVLTSGTSNNDVIEFTAYGAISFADSVKRSGDVFTSAMLVQDLIPTSNNTYSLGNTTNRFANIYLSGNTILLGDAAISSNTTHVSFVMSNGEPMPLAANLNASLPSTGVVANTYGNTTAIPVITVDEQGRITNASTSSVSGVTGLSYESSNNTLTVSTSTTNFDASIQAGLDQSYTNAVSVANTLASDAYANAVSAANTLAYDFSANAYANAVSAANTTSFNQASNAYANAVSAANTLASDFAANAYANVFLGGTFTGNVTANNVSLNGDLQVDGNLTVSGNSITLSARSLAVKDNMIYMNQGIAATITNIVGDGANVVFTADNNFANGWDVSVYGVTPSSYDGDYTDILEANATHFVVANTNTDTYVSGGTARGKTDANPDLGFAAGYNDGTYRHAGLFRDASDSRWKFFHQYEPEPDASVFIDTANNTFALANVQANYFIGTLSGDASSVGGNTASTLLAAADTSYSNAVAAAASTYLPLTGGTVSGNLSLTGRLSVGTFPNSTTNSGEAWIGRASDRSAGTLTVQLGSGSGRKFEVVDSGWTTVEFSADDSGISTSAGSSRAPIFYDSNNTGYYVDPASTSVINTTYIGSGGVRFAYGNNNRNLYLYGATDNADVGISMFDNNGNHRFQIYGGGNDYGFLNGNWSSWDLRKTKNGSMFLNNQSTYYITTSEIYYTRLYGITDIRSPILYDNNDTGYYVDPTSESRQVRIRNGPYAGSTTSGNVTGLEIINNGGTGDSNVAAISFHCSGHYGMHMHLRADSYFGIGGWSASSWRWYVQMSTGNMTCAGSSTATAFFYSSDKKLKKDIKSVDLKNSINIINSLNPVHFKWKDTDKFDTGFIAQEVQQIIPEAVEVNSKLSNEQDDQTYLTLKSSSIVAHLVKVVQELSVKINTLEAQLQQRN